MLDRHDLTDDEWAGLERLLPDRTPCRGGRWADHRIVLNGVRYLLISETDIAAAKDSWAALKSLGS